MIAKIKGAQIGVHFHQHHGMEFANVYAALLAGVQMFDSACGGLGGCPFAPAGANGNIATEHLVEFFEKLGISAGVDAALINDCGTFASQNQKEYFS